MWRWLLVVAAGCNQIYDLEPTRSHDGGSIIDPDDADADGVADVVDNCPRNANADQADTDGDATGDLCDDCALVANEQATDADGDGLGDLCDPHPALTGDCLLLVDTFADEATFEDGWKYGGAGTVTPRPGNVRLEPVPNLPDLVLQPTVASGATDMFVRGTTESSDAIVTALIGSNKTTLPYSCVLAPGEVIVDGPLTSTPTQGKLVPAVTVTLEFVSRILTNQQADASVDVFCRADHGISVGTAVSRAEPAITGEPELSLGRAPATLDAVVLLRFQPGKTCPTTIYR